MYGGDNPNVNGNPENISIQDLITKVYKNYEKLLDDSKKENYINDHELYFPDYHGVHDVDSYRVLPDNVYLCFFSLYGTYSHILTKKNLV